MPFLSRSSQGMLPAATLAAALTAVLGPHAFAQNHAGHTPELLGLGSPAAVDAADTPPPLVDGLRVRSYPITTDSAEAQAYFDQGMMLTWGFNHGEAWRAFRAAHAADPGCAMCYWGEAFALGPNLNFWMEESAVGPAHMAIMRAVELADGATPRERALIEALARRYAPTADVDRATLDQAWADAIQQVAETYPDDPDILVLFADALMNLQPWDYWEADGVTPRGRGAEIVATLEHALEIDPGHIAASHLYIHAVEASAAPERAEAVADRLRGAVPGAGHLVHMPAHIYVRVGRHTDSIEVNREAVASDDAYLTLVDDSVSPLYRFGYAPHNVHFLLVSAQMAGLAEDALSSAERLAEMTSDEVSEQLAWIQAIQTAPYTAHAQFSAPETILALADPGDRFPFIKAFWHYARGVALARQADFDGARAEAAAIDAIIDEADLAGLEAQYMPARDLLTIARLVVEARVAQADEDYAGAEARLRDAIGLEDAVPYMEPPFWYYPLRQTLGAVLLQQGRAADAAAVLEEALARSPRNAWVLWGLAEAQRATGDAGLARTEAALEAAWLGDEALLSLDRL